eukprot:scaffold85895_cov77-Cyclotella_meneghiniana.AAC.2
MKHEHCDKCLRDLETFASFASDEHTFLREKYIFAIGVTRTREKQKHGLLLILTSYSPLPMTTRLRPRAGTHLSNLNR